MIKSLYVIANDEHQPKDTKNEASSLKGKLDSLETFNKVSKKLQSKTIDLGQIKLHYSALSVYVSNWREDFDRLENLAKEKSSKVSYKYDEKRHKKRKISIW